jgi:hypothetical protein
MTSPSTEIGRSPGAAPRAIRTAKQEWMAMFAVAARRCDNGIGLMNSCQYYSSEQVSRAILRSK